MNTEQYWSPHPLDCYGQNFLIQVAHSANPPDVCEDLFGEIEMQAQDGWRVCFFYDMGELDYIDYFINPKGERLDVWHDDYQSEQSPPIMAWRGCSDTLRLRS